MWISLDESSLRALIQTLRLNVLEHVRVDEIPHRLAALEAGAYVGRADRRHCHARAVAAADHDEIDQRAQLLPAVPLLALGDQVGADHQPEAVAGVARQQRLHRAQRIAVTAELTFDARNLHAPTE